MRDDEIAIRIVSPSLTHSSYTHVSLSYTHVSLSYTHVSLSYTHVSCNEEHARETGIGLFDITPPWHIRYHTPT